MQRLTDFLQTLEANGEDPRLPVCARGMDEDEILLRRELDFHEQKLDEAVCVLAAEIMPEHVEDVFLLIGGDAKAISKSGAALRLAQVASARLDQSPELQAQFGARLAALERCRTEMKDEFDELREAKARTSVKEDFDMIVRFQEAQGGRLPSLQSHAFEKKSEEEKQAAGVLRRMRQARHADVTERRRQKRRVVQRQLTQEEVIMFEEQFGASIWRNDGAPTDYYIPADEIVDIPADRNVEEAARCKSSRRPSRRPLVCEPIHCHQCGKGFRSHKGLLQHFKTDHLLCPEQLKDTFSYDRLEEERRK